MAVVVVGIVEFVVIANRGEPPSLGNSCTPRDSPARLDAAGVLRMHATENERASALTQTRSHKLVDSEAHTLHRDCNGSM